MTSSQFRVGRSKVVAMFWNAKNTDFRLFCIILHVKLFIWLSLISCVNKCIWPHFPCTNVPSFLKIGYIADPAQQKIWGLNSLVRSDRWQFLHKKCIPIHISSLQPSCGWAGAVMFNWIFWYMGRNSFHIHSFHSFKIPIA